MNIISLYGQALTGKGEKSIDIIIDSKKDFRNRNDFLEMVSDALELYEPITFTSESKEISKDEFSNYCIWKWINKKNVELEFDKYDRYFVIFDNIPNDGIALLAESDNMYFFTCFFDAG